MSKAVIQGSCSLARQLRSWLHADTIKHLRNPHMVNFRSVPDSAARMVIRTSTLCTSTCETGSVELTE